MTMTWKSCSLPQMWFHRPRPIQWISSSNVVPSLEMADDDGMDVLSAHTLVVAPTLAHRVVSQPVHPHTEIEYRLEGRAPSCTLKIISMTRASLRSQEALKRHILSLVPVWHNKPVMLQVALGTLAVFHLRPSFLHACGGVERLVAVSYSHTTVFRCANSKTFSLHRRFAGLSMKRRVIGTPSSIASCP